MRLPGQRMLAALIGVLLLAGCDAVADPDSDHPGGTQIHSDADAALTTAGMSRTLECPGLGGTGDLDFEESEEGPPGADPDPAVAVANFARQEGFAAGQDVPLNYYHLWHRLRPDGSVRYEFRLEWHSSGKAYVQGYAMCFPGE